MSKFLGILVLLALGYGIYALVSHYKNYEDDPSAGAVASSSASGEAVPVVEEVATESLPGLPEKLQPSLKAAYERGPGGIGTWLKAYRAYATDPRLAAIELDYCVLIARTDHAQAKTVFNSVKKRVAPDSPLYPRVKRLAPTFE